MARPVVTVATIPPTALRENTGNPLTFPSQDSTIPLRVCFCCVGPRRFIPDNLASELEAAAAGYRLPSTHP